MPVAFCKEIFQICGYAVSMKVSGSPKVTKSHWALHSKSPPEVVGFLNGWFYDLNSRHRELARRKD